MSIRRFFDLRQHFLVHLLTLLAIWLYVEQKKLAFGAFIIIKLCMFPEKVASEAIFSWRPWSFHMNLMRLFWKKNKKVPKWRNFEICLISYGPHCINDFSWILIWWDSDTFSDMGEVDVNYDKTWQRGAKNRGFRR